MPPLESFAAVLVHSNDEEKIIIGFGFNEPKGALSNVIY